MYQQPTAPLSIGGVLDDGFRLLRASFSKIIVLSIIGAFASNLGGFFTAGMTPEEAAAALGNLWIVILLAAPVGVIVFGAILARIFAVVDNEEMSMGEALGVGLRRFFPILFWAIFYGLVVSVGFLLLAVPGIILFVSLSFGPYLIIREGQGPIDALNNSHRLVWGNWWRTTVLLTVMAFIFIAVYALVGVISALGVVAEEQTASAGIVANLIITLASALISPVSYAILVAIFNDLRLRKEGDDLEQRLGEIEST